MVAYLGVKIQDGDFSRLHDGLDGREAGTAVVTLDLPILQKSVLFHVPLKLLLRHKVVIVSSHFPGTNQPRCICSNTR